MKVPPDSPHEKSSHLRREGTLESIQTAIQTFTAIVLVAGLYLAREVLAPLAMAFLLAFLLMPLVKRLERRLRRIGAVVLTMLGIALLTLGGGWLIAHQAIDLAQQLPRYQQNLSAKIQSMKPADSTQFDALSKTLEDLNKEVSGQQATASATKVEVIERTSSPLSALPKILGPLSGPLGTAGLVVLLTAFILMGIEDLQARLFRLVGRGHMSSTSQALDDASHRVRKYLLMQLIVNVTYGIVLSLGLLMLGIPNAVLWGVLACVLRFIPYIGPWIAAAFPVVLSLAISPSWALPIWTLSLFIVIELLSNNVMEPMLYGSSTGVSSFALIVAAVFWTWLWGPIGLVLATPLTVVLVVVGRHVPQLSFLDVLLSEEEPLGPADNVYLRLLRSGDHGEVEVIDDYLEENSAVSLFDEILIPILSRVEKDSESGAVTLDQRKSIHRELQAVVQEVNFRNGSPEEEVFYQDPITIWCLPARAARDVVTGQFLATALQVSGFRTRAASSRADTPGLLKLLQNETEAPEILLISVIYPSTFQHARSLARKVSEAMPSQTILLGFWGHEKASVPSQGEIEEAGIEAVVTTVAEVVAFCEGYSARSIGQFKEPALPTDEGERLEAIRQLGLPKAGDEALLDLEMEELAKSLSMPMAFFSLVESSKWRLLGVSGLPEALEESRECPRSHSLCGHVVADNEPYVIADIQKDRRFSGNPLLREHGFRFYAGVPVHAPNGQPIGSLCVMDTKPRRFSPRQMRQLEKAAREISKRVGAEQVEP
jgi:predicted PurR-regulated permease PerM